jgi:hypothetical protein
VSPHVVSELEVVSRVGVSRCLQPAYPFLAPRVSEARDPLLTPGGGANRPRRGTAFFFGWPPISVSRCSPTADGIAPTATNGCRAPLSTETLAYVRRRWGRAADGWRTREPAAVSTSGWQRSRARPRLRAREHSRVAPTPRDDARTEIGRAKPPPAAFLVAPGTETSLDAG